MADLVKDLNNLDFKVYIGGPMQAAVAAQIETALAQVDFIKSVGFNDDLTALRYVDFQYDKTLPTIGQDGYNEVSRYKLSVPLLSIVQIPSLRIDEMTIDFNAKLNSVETASTESELGVDAALGIRAGFVNLRASVSYKRKTTNGSQVERAYDMGVHVRVVNDEIPAGLDRILRILENEIKDRPHSNNVSPAPHH